MTLTLTEAESLVRECIYISLEPNQFNALASLARDIGEYNFRRSKIVNYVNIGTPEAILLAAKLFCSYGRPTKKNRKQRNADRDLFLKLSVIHGGKNDNPQQQTS